MKIEIRRVENTRLTRSCPVNCWAPNFWGF